MKESKKEVEMGKKGQVTLFIIIGIVLLISMGLFFYFKGTVIGDVEIIHTELNPVVNYVNGCVEQTARDALTRLGLNGGFITLPRAIDQNPNAYLQIAPFKTLRNPYWWFSGKSNVPTLAFQEEQLEGYIDGTLADCFNNFDAFSGEYILNAPSLIKSKVAINEEDVKVEINYPLEVISRLNQTSTAFEKFSVTLPIRLKKVYELAKTIMEKENAEGFVEEKVIDLIVLDNDIPTTDIAFTCRKQVWRLSEIEQKLKRLVRVNVPYIRIAGTAYDPDAYVPTPLGKNEFKNSYFSYHYVWEIDKETRPGMHVSFTFNEDWPFSLAARPSDGNVLQSNAQQGQDLLSLVCMNLWHFTYDVEFPVMVTVVDDEVAGHERFAYNFAFMVNIDTNRAVRVNTGTDIYRSEERMTSEEYCGNVRNEVTITVDDNITITPVPGASLEFICGPFSCDIGESVLLSGGAAAGFRGKLPYCVNALVKAKKDNYLLGQSFIQTEKEGSLYSVFMTPIKAIKQVKVIKHPAANPALEEELESQDVLAVVLRQPEYDFTSYTTFPYTEDFPLQFLAKDTFTYDIDVYMTHNDKATGGYKGKWTVNPNALANAEELILHVVEKRSFLNDNERALFIGNLDKESQKVPEPELR